VQSLSSLSRMGPILPGRVHFRLTRAQFFFFFRPDLNAQSPVFGGMPCRRVEFLAGGHVPDLVSGPIILSFGLHTNQ